MDVPVFDLFPKADDGIAFVGLDELLEQADVISPHCPLTLENHHAEE